MAMGKDGLDLFLWNTSPMYPIHAKFEQVMIIPKVVLGIRKKFLPLLIRELRRDGNTCMKVEEISKPRIAYGVDTIKLLINEGVINEKFIFS
jgi:CRISPR/Cas system-associated protein Csm6